MSKKNFVSLVIGTLGVVLFALGMCMTMLPHWDAFTPGIILGIAGIVVLLVLVGVRRKMSGKSVIPHVSGKTLAAVGVGIAGALALGAGMCLVMLWDKLIFGIIVGLAGILVLLCLIPLTKGLTD